MPWVIFSTVSLFLTVFYGLISKKILSNKKSNLDSTAYTSAMCFCVTIVSLIFWFWGNTVIADISSLLNTKILLVLILNIGVYTLASPLYYRALKNLPYSLVTIIYSLAGFFAFLIGLIFGIDSLSLAGVTGSLLIVISVGMVSFNVSELRATRYLLILFLATFLYSIAASLDNNLSSHFSPFFYVSLTFGFPGIFMLFVNRVPRHKILQAYKPKNLLPIAINAFFIASSYLCIYEAYRLGGSAAKVYSLLAMETVLTVILAAIFLGERKNLVLKFIAAIVASFGVYLLTTY